MFPHNSSSHEISTETNAFVQNSKGDVVVLEGSSLSGVGEGNGPEDAGYCDIEFINSSSSSATMAAPTSHPEATAANDFSTVLTRHSGELGSAGMRSGWRSPGAVGVVPSESRAAAESASGEIAAVAATVSTSSHDNSDKHDNSKAYDNNRELGVAAVLAEATVRELGSSNSSSKSSNNNNNAEHNHHHNHHMCRKARRGVSAPCRWPGGRPLLRRRLRPASQAAAANSKSTSKPLSDNKDSFRSVSSRVLSLRSGSGRGKDKMIMLMKKQKMMMMKKMKNRPLILGPTPSLVRIPKSDGQRAFNLKAKNSHVSYFKPNNSKSVISLSSSSSGGGDNGAKRLRQQPHSQQQRLARTASSSITLIVSKRREPRPPGAGRQLLFFTASNGSTISSSIENNNSNSNNNATATTIELQRRLISALCVPLTIGTPVGLGCAPISRRLIDGISCTEATICTVGALSFRDNNKSNEPLNISFKSAAQPKPTGRQRESNLILKSLTLSKSTPSVKSSDKSDDTDVVTIITTNNNNINDDDERRRSGVASGRLERDLNNNDNNIPIPTTCEPTMTLKSQLTSATSTVTTSQTNDVPAAREPRPLLTALLDGQERDFNEEKNEEENNNSEIKEKASEMMNEHDAKTRENLVKDCKDLIADYQIKRDPRHLTRLREVLSSLLNIDRDDRRGATCAEEARRPTHPSAVESNDYLLGYKQRWGIPTVLGLAGGGESSLNNSATANWASAQPTTPNNNNQNQSGWGNSGSGSGTPGNQSVVGGQTGPNNWQSVPGPRAIGNQISNQNPNQNQSQGPPGPQNNQGSNAPSGPPTSQQNNQNQANPGSGGGQQWNQSGAKSGNNVNSPNPQGQNNNGGNVPPPQQQQQQQSPQQQQQSQQAPNQQQQPQPPTAGNNNPQLAGNSVPGNVSTATTPTSNNPTTKAQFEQLNNMREALFSPDGWGCNHVNQDTNWDVPTSPEPIISKEGIPVWKPTVNNGTDLWEANLRNGGQPPPQQQAKAPWGHTPSTNIGGTWGEDDDAADSSNMWTGAPAPSQPNAGQWPGSSANQSGNSWGDPRVDPRDPRDPRSVNPREMRGTHPRDNCTTIDLRDPTHPRIRLHGSMSHDLRMSGEMRGDPRGGISGRLNGASNDNIAMWNLPPVEPPAGPPHHQMPGHQHPSGPPQKMLASSNQNQWSAPPPKDMIPGKPSGWEEPSPPTQRRTVPNYDDGTSLWANPQSNQRTMPSKVSHWKEPSQNLGRGGMQCPPGILQNQMPPGQPNMKLESVDGGASVGASGGAMWGGHPGSGGPAAGGHNGSWGEPPEPSNWGEGHLPTRKRFPTMPPVMDPHTGKPLGWDERQKPQPMGPTAAVNWMDSDVDPSSSWGHSAKLNLTKEQIYKSRQFRYLCDLGFKKEDVEVALRSREMNRDEAQELLSQLRPMDQWRRDDVGHSGYDSGSQSAGGQPFPRFNHVNQPMSFPQQRGNLSDNLPQAQRNPQNQPSTQQLRMLVQQIQLAVHEGYLNHQILNQPLAPQTLMLLNQLLQQIKVLQQLHQQHSMQNSLKGNSQAVLQISVQITKTKQQIANLQNQIAVQQATYMKQQQQQQQQQQHPSTPSQSEYYKSSAHDPMSALQNSFSDLTMNKEAPVSQQQSRLNQWKLPSLDKDADSVVNEFSRAPGSSSSKSPTTPGGLSQSHSSPNMNPLLGPGDGTWSSRLGDTSGWPDTANSDSTDGKDWQSPQSAAGAAFTDLVPEFEPGKPWKMKSIEDDPSITPGSVVRSPLSVAAIKDSETLFSTGSKTSPPPQSLNADSSSIPSLSNSTWSFNPPATTPSGFASSKNAWGEPAPPPTAVTSELWGAPMNKSRGPPPGLGSKGTNPVTNASNGWGLGGRSTNTWSGLQSNAPGAGAAGTSWPPPSTWLLLRNLTPQIDGSTLKTLCMQHGPVSDFRLYLNHGVALAKYSSRQEANKAQCALNNCVLGNTTIFAESPLDNEIETLLQQLLPSSGAGGGPTGTGAQQSSTGAGWGLRPPTVKAAPPPDTWGAASASQLWGAPQASNSLWSSSSLDTSDQQRATPSSLNSYLPGDLLGNETM